MASTLLLGTLNRIDAATLAGGSWQSTLPLANIKDRRLSRLARTTNASAGSTLFTIDLGAARNVGVLALIVHNLSVLATVRIYGDDAADFATPVYDSGSIAVWPAGAIPQELLEWEDDNFWLGTVSQEAIAGYKAPFIHAMSTAQTLRYWKVVISDSGNADGYVQMGRVYIGEAWKPDYNRSYGASLGYEDESKAESSLAGEEFFDIRRRRRVHRFELGFLSEEEARDRVLQMQRLQGTTGEILIVPDVTDSINFAKVAFLGRLKSPSPVAQPSPTFFSTQIEALEII